MQSPSDSVTCINRDTSPVHIDITDQGFPADLPALRWHARALSRNPWIRRRFGHFALIDAWGQELLALGYGQVEGDLERRIAQYREANAEQASRPAPRPPQESHDHTEVLPEHLRHGPLSLHWMTAYELSFDHWQEVVEVLVDGERVAPGVRNAAIHSLAEFLNADVNYRTQDLRVVGFTMRKRSGHPLRNLAVPKQAELHERAAVALARIAGLPFDTEEPTIVAQVRSWWAEHRSDDAYRIEWSTDPKLRYTFLR